MHQLAGHLTMPIANQCLSCAGGTLLVCCTEVLQQTGKKRVEIWWCTWPSKCVGRNLAACDWKGETQAIVEAFTLGKALNTGTLWIENSPSW